MIIMESGRQSRLEIRPLTLDLEDYEEDDDDDSVFRPIEKFDTLVGGLDTTVTVIIVKYTFIL